VTLEVDGVVREGDRPNAELTRLRDERIAVPRCGETDDLEARIAATGEVAHDIERTRADRTGRAKQEDASSDPFAHSSPPPFGRSPGASFRTRPP
jgi:hypothetical protein